MHPSGKGWDTLRAGLAGALVAAVLTMSFPVAAAVGDALKLGQANSADAVTSLSGSSAANLRITNNLSGSPALDLRVRSGAAPLKVNSTTLVVKLNADLLDGKHLSFFLPATGTAADSSLLEGRASTAYQAAPCPPGRTLRGYDRSGPVCDEPLLGSLQLDYSGDVGSYPSLVLDASGYPVIAYYDNTNHDLKLVHCGNADCTSGNAIVAADTPGDVGQGISLALDDSGYPVIAANKTGGSLRLVRCGDANCANRALATVRANGVSTYAPSLALSSTGDDPIIAYTLSSGYLAVLHCGNDTCGSGNTETQVVGPGAYVYLSMVLDAFGSPVIAYMHDMGGSTQLEVIRCRASDCTTSNSTNVAYSLGGGFYPSLVLDEDGFPVIAHQDQSGDGSALVTYCGNATCSSGNNTIWAGSSGFYPSLVLDVAGHPIISFYDHVNMDLRLAALWLGREEFPAPES